MMRSNSADLTSFLLNLGFALYNNNIVDNISNHEHNYEYNVYNLTNHHVYKLYDKHNVGDNNNIDIVHVDN